MVKAHLGVNLTSITIMSLNVLQLTLKSLMSHLIRKLTMTQLEHV